MYAHLTGQYVRLTYMYKKTIDELHQNSYMFTVHVYNLNALLFSITKLTRRIVAADIYNIIDV